MTRTIEIVITPGGKTTVKTRGFVGSSCQEASRLIEQALGKRTGQQRTAEFYQAESAATQHRQQN